MLRGENDRMDILIVIFHILQLIIVLNLVIYGYKTLRAYLKFVNNENDGDSLHSCRNGATACLIWFLLFWICSLMIRAVNANR